MGRKAEEGLASQSFCSSKSGGPTREPVSKQSHSKSEDVMLWRKVKGQPSERACRRHVVVRGLPREGFSSEKLSVVSHPVAPPQLWALGAQKSPLSAVKGTEF